MSEVITAERATEVVKALLGETAVKISYPGGTRRKSLRVQLKDRSVILSRRNTEERTALEAGVLRELGEAGAPVPALIEESGTWLIQQDIAGKRLSERLAECDAADDQAGLERLLAAALESMAQYQHLANRIGLQRRVAEIGARRQGWLEDLVTVPLDLNEYSSSPAPEYDQQAVIAALQTDQRGFVKWDARSGNALVDADGRVIWIDWEHCGLRHPLDDLAWLMCDEYTPDLTPETEARILSAGLRLLGQDPSQLRYLFLFGTLHMCVRLNLILSRWRKRGWSDLKSCLKYDAIGTTPMQAERLFRRAARWSAASGELSGLSQWFADQAAWIRSQPQDASSRVQGE